MPPIRERKDVPAADRWDLTEMFADDSAWEVLFREVEERLVGYGAYRGRLGETASILRAALDFDLGLSRDLERLSAYARMSSDEDLGEQEAQARLQRVADLQARAQEAASFLGPEIQAVPGETMRGFLASAELEGYGYLLEQTLRWRPHTRSAEVEEVLAQAAPALGSEGRTFQQLTDADFEFGRVRDAAGRDVPLSHGSFIRFLHSPDRRVRREAYEAYYRQYRLHRNSLAAMLEASARSDFFSARVRGFSSCLAASLFGDDVPESVYLGLIAGVRSGLESLHGYLRLRRERLELDELEIYDTYVPLAGAGDFRMEYDEAVEVCLEALAPLGEEYVGILGRGLRGGWVDRYENRRKRSGAYCCSCYDAHPGILLNYDPESITGLYTLAHEAGHAMHSFLSDRSQPYRYHSYRIFTAEVASTCNEILLSRFLLERRRQDRDLRAYVLNREIDNIRATLYRQTMFAEFELAAHALVEQHSALTLDSMTGIYRGLLEAYFGGIVAIDEFLPLECLRIPHFYSAFYVYKYATGLAAALALAEGVLKAAPGARDAYLDFLSLGGSLPPLECLRAAGVEMTSPEPVQRALGSFSGLVEEFRKL